VKLFYYQTEPITQFENTGFTR